jgi:hypothetical protein
MCEFFLLLWVLGSSINELVICPKACFPCSYYWQDILLLASVTGRAILLPHLDGIVDIERADVFMLCFFVFPSGFLDSGVKVEARKISSFNF